MSLYTWLETTADEYGHYGAIPSAPDAWTALPLTVGVRTVVLTVTYGYSKGVFEVGVTANVPAQALRAALPSLNGWLVRVVIDTP